MKRTKILKMVVNSGLGLAIISMVNVAAGLIGGLTMNIVNGIKVNDFEKDYKDNETFLQFCLEDNDLKALYKNTIYVAKHQYANDEINKSQLDKVEDDFFKQARTKYSSSDYLRNTQDETIVKSYEKAKRLEGAGEWWFISTVPSLGACGLGYLIAAAGAKTYDKAVKKEENNETSAYEK